MDYSMDKGSFKLRCIQNSHFAMSGKLGKETCPRQGVVLILACLSCSTIDQPPGENNAGRQRWGAGVSTLQGLFPSFFCRVSYLQTSVLPLDTLVRTVQRSQISIFYSKRRADKACYSSHQHIPLVSNAMHLCDAPEHAFISFSRLDFAGALVGGEVVNA